MIELSFSPAGYKLIDLARLKPRRITPQSVLELGPGEVFVFGSNLLGIHGAGAALLARRAHGAVLGVGEGPTGRCYALPTKLTPRDRMTVDELRVYVNRFVEHAWLNPQLHYLVTEVGCGLAGFRVDQVGPMFWAAAQLENVSLPARFWAWLADHSGHTGSSVTADRLGTCRDHRSEDCRIHDELQARALVVGERLNLDPGEHLSGWPASFAARPYAGMVGRGAFLEGGGRDRLLALGVRWNAAANLLWPAPIGEWDSKAGTRWADALFGHLQDSGDHRLIFLCGQRVADAAGGIVPMSVTKVGRLVLVALPDPNRQDRLWSDPSFFAATRAFVQDAYRQLT